MAEATNEPDDHDPACKARIEELHGVLYGPGHSLPGHVSKQLGPGETIELPVMQPGDLAALPEDVGVYRVETYSGTVHIITIRPDEVLWERRPVDGAGFTKYDYEAVRCQLRSGWEVGTFGMLEIHDGAYLDGDSTLRTSPILRISRVDDEEVIDARRLRPESSGLSNQEVIAGLIEMLGVRLAAYFAFLGPPTEIWRLVAGEIEVSDDIMKRCRLAYDVARLKTSQGGKEAARDWLLRPNDSLGGRSWASRIREGDLDELAGSLLRQCSL